MTASQEGPYSGVNHVLIRIGVNVTDRPNLKVTYKVDLPGGQRRLKEAILHIAQKGEPMEYFGRVKLNKIIWRADFLSFFQRRQPVTGRTYQKLKQGPALIEITPVMHDLLRDGFLIEETRLHGRRQEHRPVAKADPVLKLFSPEDLEFLDESLRHYWTMTGTETSDESHGIAWKTHQIGDAIPYEASYFEDKPLPETTLRRIAKDARNLNLRSI